MSGEYSESRRRLLKGGALVGSASVAGIVPLNLVVASEKTLQMEDVGEARELDPKEKDFFESMGIKVDASGCRTVTSSTSKDPRTGNPVDTDRRCVD